MIRIMTLNTGEQSIHSINRMQECTDPLHSTRPDILCCQSIRRTLDGREDTSRTLSQSLGLVPGCFAAIRSPHTTLGQSTEEVTGLAILTGAGVWILNSGSLSIPGDQEGEEGIVQFALVRKNTTSVLVLNLQLADSKPSQQLQLLALFAHPLLKERFGAVVLCSDRPTALSNKKFQGILLHSSYGLHHSLVSDQTSSSSGMMCLLKAKTEEGTTTLIGNADTRQLPQLGLALEFEMKRNAKDQKRRPYLPLSFREQWLGCKEKYPAFAA